MATTGIRELRNNLSRYLDRVRKGEEVTVTARGAAVARIVPVDHTPAFDRLLAAGLIEVAPSSKRVRPDGRVPANGPVSDLVAEQRR